VTETWKAVPGFEGLYEVSDMGRVRSLDRVITQMGRGGKMISLLRRGRVLRPGPSTAGHLTVALGRGKSHLVHYLVLRAFVSPRPEGMECLHLNGVETDNRLENLAWGSRSENGRHKKWHRGQSTYKLSPAQVAEIKARLVTSRHGAGVKLAAEFGVSTATISAIKNGRTHIDVACGRN
jgi:hypothetical protein